MPQMGNGQGYGGGAVDALGLGDMLADQVSGETEEQRKRRIAELQQRSLMGPAVSPANQMLFGTGYSQGATL